MKIKDNIWNLRPFRTSEDVPGIHCFLVKDSGGLTLIDTGLTGKTEDIIREIRRFGENPRDLKRILLTHGHEDNMGNSEMLQKVTGCKVYASDTEIMMLHGKTARINPKAGVPRPDFKLPVLTAFPHSGIGAFGIINTPGHTAGHVSFCYEDVLFAGDACTLKKGKLTDPDPMFCEDATAARESWRRIDLHGYKNICIIHGPNLGFVCTGE